MANMKYIKRALLSSITALFLCLTMFVGTTYAWFTDSVTSKNNVIQTGNLGIEVTYTLDGDNWNALDGADDLFQNGLWEPGHTEVVALRVKNVGSLALKYMAKMNLVGESVGKNVEGEDIVLSEILDVSTLTLLADTDGDNALALVFDEENASDVWDAALTASFKEMNVLQDAGELVNKGDAHYIFIKVDMPETVGNEASHDGVNVPSIEFGLNVFATQLAYESDSFGNEYDKEATYDDYWDANVDTSWYNETDTAFTLRNANQLAGLAKLVNTGVDTFSGKTFTLTSNVSLGNEAWWPIGTSTNPFKGTFDGNGNTVSNLFVDAQSNYVGLFGYVATGVSVSNLTIDNVVIVDTDESEDTSGCGALIGRCAGVATLDNVHVTGNVQIESNWYTSGLIGQSKGSVITNCSVVGNDGSFISSGRWASGLSGYDNGALKMSNCHVENVELKAAYYAGSLASLGAAGANINSNTAKDVEIVLSGETVDSSLAYGVGVGGVSVYSYSTTPITLYNNTYDNVNCVVKGVAVQATEAGSKYADGTDQGLIMMPVVKAGNNYYTYLKKALEAAPKDGSEFVIELVGDTMITAKFKPQVAKGQNVVIKTNGYDLIWVEQDANKVPVVNADGSYVTTVVTAENMSSYITVKSGGALVIE